MAPQRDKFGLRVPRKANLGSREDSTVDVPFASDLIAKNVHLATIQRLMGHSSISMTEVYLHISNELKEEAVARLGV